MSHFKNWGILIPQKLTDRKVRIYENESSWYSHGDVELNKFDKKYQRNLLTENLVYKLYINEGKVVIHYLDGSKYIINTITSNDIMNTIFG